MDNQFNLTGRSALVTGATGYLGAEMALALGTAGAHVVVQARSDSAAVDLCRLLQSAGATATPAVFDLTNDQAVDSYCASADAEVDILVNNAYSGGGGTVASSSPASFRDAMEIGLIAPHRLTRNLLPSLTAAAASGDASVVNIASMYGTVSPDLRLYATEDGSNPPYYGAAKAALIQYTRYAACELGPAGVRVNAIAPGPFPNANVRSQDSDFVHRLQSRVPLGRVAEPHEIRGPLLFLASSAASYVTGTVLAVDGGWTAW